MRVWECRLEAWVRAVGHLLLRAPDSRGAPGHTVQNTVLASRTASAWVHRGKSTRGPPRGKSLVNTWADLPQLSRSVWTLALLATAAIPSHHLVPATTKPHCSS